MIERNDKEKTMNKGDAVWRHFESKNGISTQIFFLTSVQMGIQNFCSNLDPK